MPAAPPAQAIDSLKDEVLQFDSDASALEQDALYPAYGRTTVSVGVQVYALLLQEIAVSIDGGEPKTLKLNGDDARALVGGSRLARVLRIELAPGAHRIHASFKAQYADAGHDAAPLTGTYEAVFDQGYGANQLELSLTRLTRLSRPALTLRQWRLQR